MAVRSAIIRSGVPSSFCMARGNRRKSPPPGSSLHHQAQHAGEGVNIAAAQAHRVV